jgi:hypothetical protein
MMSGSLVGSAPVAWQEVTVVSEFEFIGTERAKARRPEEGAPASAIARLQSSLGNSGLARMLQREAAPEEEELQTKKDPSLAAAFAQRQEEPEEEELQTKKDPSLAAAFAQRESAPEDDEMQAKHDPLQRAPEVGMAGGAVSNGLAGRIDSARGGGSPLDTTTRSTMEDTLGTSLDGVRVHVGQESDELNHAITAKAFTTGNDVFVRSDQWAPGSSDTQRLMAHELTHVAQQRSGVGGGESGMTVGAADTHEEREADAIADTVAQRALQRQVQRHADGEEQA